MEDRNSRADKIEAECSVLARRPGLYGRLNAVRGGKFPDDAGDPPNQAITSSLVVLLSFLVVLIITLSHSFHHFAPTAAVSDAYHLIAHAADPRRRHRRRAISQL